MANVRAGQVFVAGGFPKFTYIARSESNFEEKISDYLDERHRILSISGPTKTGKTVLVKKALQDEDSIWISGGTVASEENFWDQISDSLHLHTEFESDQIDEDSSYKEHSGEIGISPLKGGIKRVDSVTTARGSRSGRKRSASAAAREALRSSLYPLVVDDFHYIDSEVQLGIVRSLKDLIFDGLPVIIIAVPHRAYDVLRVEKEMTGRVEQLNIGFWSAEELIQIPRIGFAKLNLVDKEDKIARRLTRESFSSPHLMQDFCLNVCKVRGHRTGHNFPKRLNNLSQSAWSSFFYDRASNTSRTAFDLLARGPRQRSDRKIRTLNNGTTTDIYGAVLLAIAATGPNLQITYEGLRASLRAVLSDELPQKREITRVLEEMTKIARDVIPGEPVVDYDDELAALHISDPYFAYYLRWRANPNMTDLAENEVYVANFTSGNIGKSAQVVQGHDFMGNVVIGDSIADTPQEEKHEIEQNTTGSQDG